MTRDRTFQDTASRVADFVFDEHVAEVFDDMAERSIPFYQEQQELIRELAQKFYQPGTFVYDLGCSTGTTLMGVAKALGPQAPLVGYDSSESMLAKARAAKTGTEAQIELRLADLNADTENIGLSNASVVTLGIDFYYEFKRRNGYSEQEIARKREALENVLVPYRVEENFELLRRCGFEVVETFFQWYNFAGFMAVKKG